MHGETVKKEYLTVQSSLWNKLIYTVLFQRKKVSDSYTRTQTKKWLI